MPMLHLIVSYSAYAYVINGETKLPMVLYSVILLLLMMDTGAGIYRETRGCRQSPYSSFPIYIPPQFKNPISLMKDNGDSSAADDGYGGRNLSGNRGELRGGILQNVYRHEKALMIFHLISHCKKKP